MTSDLHLEQQYVGLGEWAVVGTGGRAEIRIGAWVGVGKDGCEGVGTGGWVSLGTDECAGVGTSTRLIVGTADRGNRTSTFRKGFWRAGVREAGVGNINGRAARRGDTAGGREARRADGAGRHLTED